MFKLFAVSAVLSLVALATADSQCTGAPNAYGYWSGTPTFVAQVKNGKLYTAGSGDDMIDVVHVWGTPYEQGYAHGILVKDKATGMLPRFYKHVLDEAEQYMKGLPKEIQDFIVRFGLDAALDLTYEMTKEWTAPDVFEELRGLSDATGMDYHMIRNLHMLPELVKAGCSMFNAWGSSLTDPSGFYQLRALDWDTDGGLQNYPTVVVYHPPEDGKYGHAYANVAWAGFIATLTGMSSKRLGISEKHSDIPFGEESRIGYPFPFLMRDILRHDNSLFDAIRRIQEARRTCSIWMGVGDGNSNVQQGRIFQYSYSTATVLSDKNITKYTNISRFEREHCDETCYDNFLVPDAVYFGVHLGCWNEQMLANHGKIDINVAINMTAAVRTGNLHLAFYDLKNMYLYVANARADNETGPDDAYQRQFVQLDAGALFAEPEPTQFETIAPVHTDRRKESKIQVQDGRS